MVGDVAGERKKKVDAEDRGAQLWISLFRFALPVLPTRMRIPKKMPPLFLFYTPNRAHCTTPPLLVLGFSFFHLFLGPNSIECQWCQIQINYFGNKTVLSILILTLHYEREKGNYVVIIIKLNLFLKASNYYYLFPKLKSFYFKLKSHK